MVLIEHKKFSEEESKLFYNLKNKIFMDNNGNILIRNDDNDDIFRYENTLTKNPITTKIYDDLIQNINNTTLTTQTLGLINNNPEDDNPCLSKNGNWILHRTRLLEKDKEYKPIYSLSYSTEQLPVIINGPDYLLLFGMFLIGIVVSFLILFLFNKLKKNNKYDLKV